ncbi:MAG: diguanylate cyclase [Phycisphaerales bacterium]|nr:diguanylate cyclase [Phycisphaerales bacterium]MCB9856445.1 diguanylate cyclase [Phycisphaerales bacterium]
MQTINILLADDDPGHRYLLNRVITEGRPFVRMTTVQDFDEFRLATKSGHFDCAVIDFNMSSDRHADDFVAHLQSVHPNCPVIIVSGSDEQAVAVRSFRCGGADFIHKDQAVECDVLWSRIRSLIKSRKRRIAERRLRERREAQLRAMAQSDALTGLANRRAIDQLFSDDGRSILDRRAESSIIMLDIDHFKQVNDVCGHCEGDRILRSLSALMRNLAEPHDIVARWGGEEFLVIRPRTGLVESVRWAENLRTEVSKSIRCGVEKTQPVTVSLGVFTIKSSNLELSSIEKADAALYLAKRRGRNRVCTWGLCQFESKIPCSADLSPEARLDQSLEQMLPSLGPTQREHLTSHSCSVSTAAMLVGMTANLDGQALDALRFAGLCHDIGKVAIPESVLSKPGPLDSSERLLVDMHADDGAYLSAKLGFSPRVASMVRESHVRFDNADSSSIDPASSALSVADAYVAMTSERPYHKKHSSTEAFEELRRERGKQFDPRAVDACIACFSV